MGGNDFGHARNQSLHQARKHFRWRQLPMPSARGHDDHRQADRRAVELDLGTIARRATMIEATDVQGQIGSRASAWSAVAKVPSPTDQEQQYRADGDRRDPRRRQILHIHPVFGKLVAKPALPEQSRWYAEPAISGKSRAASPARPLAPRQRLAVRGELSLRTRHVQHVHREVVEPGFTHAGECYRNCQRALAQERLDTARRRTAGALPGCVPPEPNQRANRTPAGRRDCLGAAREHGPNLGHGRFDRAVPAGYRW